MVEYGVAKRLCDWTKKEIKKHFEEVCEVVSEPRYVCRECARSASQPQYLCEPKKMEPPKKE
jgi:hypothetical protein